MKYLKDFLSFLRDIKGRIFCLIGALFMLFLLGVMIIGSVSALARSVIEEIVQQNKMAVLIEENERSKWHPFCTNNDDLWLYNITGLEVPIRHPDGLSCTEFKEHQMSDGLDIPFEKIIILYKPLEVK